MLASTIFLAAAGALQVFYGLLNVDPVGHDSHLHPMWLEMFARQVADGNPFPRWLTATYGGFGSPTFYYYPPLTYYLGSAFSAIGLAQTGKGLFHAVHITGGLLALGTTYLLLRDQKASRLAALASALMVAFSPYSFIDVFSRSALSEHLAIAWLPLLFLGTTQVIRGEMRGWSISVVGWTLLLLTSIPASCCAVLGWLGFIALAPERNARKVMTLASSLIIAVAISAFYLLPALGLSSLISLDRYHSASEVNVIKAMFVKSKLGITLRGGVLLILAISAYQLFAHRRSLRAAGGWSALLLVALVFQLPFVTDWLYTTLQPFKMIRFPWRLTMLAVLGLAVILSKPRVASALLILSIALLSLLFYSAYGINHVMTGERTPLHIAKRDAPEYITRFVPHDDSATMRFVVANERSAIITAPDHGIADHSFTIENAVLTSDGIDAEVHTSHPSIITLHQFFWPFWEVRFNGRQLRTKPDTNGLLTAELPAGNGVLSARIQRASVEITGTIISLISICVFAAMHFWKLRRQTSTSGQDLVP